MGLCISHNTFAASYSTFHGYRTYLAKLIDIDLRNMEGFNPDNAERIISWHTINDGLKILLDHSDCEGELTVEDAVLLRKRLCELLPLMQNDHFWFEVTCEFLSGLNQAICRKEKLTFG